MFRTSSISALAIALATTANAGGLTPTPVDPIVDTPTYVAAPSADWSGFYIGGTIAGGRLDNGPDTSDTRGFGVQAGYLADLGNYVVGGELAYVKGEATDDSIDGDLTSTRLKAIGGYDAGSWLPYVTLGVSRMDGNDATDTGMLYGVGAKYAINQSWTAGVEYLVESKDNFDDTGFDVENRELGLSVSYRF